MESSLGVGVTPSLTPNPEAQEISKNPWQKLPKPARTAIVVVVVAALFVLMVLLWRRKRKKSVYRRQEEIDEWCYRIAPTETIFVSVASYRDPECARTLHDMFEKAACPFRVFAGVCQQNAPRDQDVVKGYENLARGGVHDFSDNIRVYAMSADEAQGPMYARAMIEQQLYRNEKYYLVIDSHTLFTPNWDVNLIKDLEACPSEKPVLTMYPDDFSSARKTPSANTPPSFLRFKRFNEKSALPEVEGPQFRRAPKRPIRSLFWGACFSFARADMIHEVPYDPHCPYVFLGEELLMAARLYTHGWDTYSPTRMWVRHMWTRRRPTFWEVFQGNSAKHRERQAMEEEGYHRMRRIMGLDSSQPGDGGFGAYGLGRVRSLVDFQNFIGINLGTQQIYPKALLGIGDAPEYDEIFAKFGSLTQYHIALKKAQFGQKP